MIIPIRCFSCNKVIADKYEWYLEKSKKLEKQENGEKVHHFYGVPTKKLLDELGLTRYCCRRMLIAHADMMDVI